MVDNTRQQTLSTTAALVIHESKKRSSFSIANMDAAIIVYISTRPNVTSSTGFPIYPKTVMSFNETDDNVISPRYAIAASGTPIIALDEEFT